MRSPFWRELSRIDVVEVNGVSGNEESLLEGIVTTGSMPPRSMVEMRSPFWRELSRNSACRLRFAEGGNEESLLEGIVT